MLVSTSVPNLVNGVSQQAENLRFPSQCAEQVNAFSSVLHGLLKRPPTQHVAALDLGSGPKLIDHINRSPSERYAVVYGNQTLKVFTLGGTEVPVKNAAGADITTGDLAYLNGHDKDHESGLNPLAHALARVSFVLQNIAEGTAIDDRYKAPTKGA